MIFYSFYYLDKTSVICTLKKQILSLVVDINKKEIYSFPKDDSNAIIFAHIFSMFTNLRYLKFCLSADYHQRLSFQTTSLTVISTNLLDLRVCLDNFNDCLYLLDGRFQQLHTLYVDIAFIFSSPLTIKNEVVYF
jgi:hypothetical protein